MFKKPILKNEKKKDSLGSLISIIDKENIDQNTPI